MLPRPSAICFLLPSVAILVCGLSTKLSIRIENKGCLHRKGFNNLDAVERNARRARNKWPKASASLTQSESNTTEGSKPPTATVTSTQSIRNATVGSNHLPCFGYFYPITIHNFDCHFKKGYF